MRPRSAPAPTAPAACPLRTQYQLEKARCPAVPGAERCENQHHRHIFYGPKGYLAIDGYDAYKTWLTDQAEPGPSGSGAGDHYANFIDCIRSRRAEDIHSPVEEAHISTTLVHLANASYRLGRTLKFDPAQEQVVGDDEANRLLRGTYRAPYIVPEEV